MAGLDDATGEGKVSLVLREIVCVDNVYAKYKYIFLFFSFFFELARCVVSCFFLGGGCGKLCFVSFWWVDRR